MSSSSSESYEESNYSDESNWSTDDEENKDESSRRTRNKFKEIVNGINKPKPKGINKSIYQNRWRAKQYSKIHESYPFPEAKLEFALRVLKSKTKPRITNSDKARHFCQHRIFLNRNSKHLTNSISGNSVKRMVCEMATCLQNQDWYNLARLITILCEDVRLADEKTLLLKYALIALLYNPNAKDSGLFDSFLQGVCECRNEVEMEDFFNIITELPESRINDMSRRKNTNETLEDEEEEDDHAKDIIDAIRQFEMSSTMWTYGRKVRL